DDQIERGVFEIVKGFRPVARKIETDLVHDRLCEGVRVACPDAAGVDVNELRMQVAHDVLRHRDAYGIGRADEEHTLRRPAERGACAHPRMCRTQIRVNSRRAVSLSTSILLSSRRRSRSDPSLCKARRPISIASIFDGLAVLIAS